MPGWENEALSAFNDWHFKFVAAKLAYRLRRRTAPSLMRRTAHLCGRANRRDHPAHAHLIANVLSWRRSQ